jgi:hypothetical protein
VFVEFERKTPLALLAVGSAVLVVLFGRRRGALIESDAVTHLRYRVVK